MTRRALTRRETGILRVVIAAAVVLALYRGVYFSYKNRREDLQVRIAHNEKLLEKNLRAIQKSKAYEQKNQQLLDVFKQVGSDEQVMSSMISEIEQTAAALKIHLSDMKPQKNRKVDFFNQFSVSLILDGQITPIMNFIHLLQNTPHLFEVTELRLEKKSFNSNDLKCYLVLNRLLILP
jgi:Tfp pilus assembly protein PilO